MAHEHLNVLFGRFLDLNQLLLSVDDRIEQAVLLMRAEVRSLEPEIFGEMESVRAAVHGRAVGDVGSVPAAHRTELVPERLLELARDHATVGAPADELLF